MSRYKVLDIEYPHFITSTIIEWVPIFTSEKYFNILIDTFKYCQKELGLKIYGYVILDNHFHMIVYSQNLPKIIQSIKRHSAKKIIELAKNDEKTWLLNQLSFHKQKYKIKSNFQVWQNGFHPKSITIDEIFHQKLDYIHNNPVKRGLVEKPQDWLYSSARNYILEDNTIIKIDKFF